MSRPWYANYPWVVWLLLVVIWMNIPRHIQKAFLDTMKQKMKMLCAFEAEVCLLLLQQQQQIRKSSNLVLQKETGMDGCVPSSPCSQRRQGLLESNDDCNDNTTTIIRTTTKTEGCKLNYTALQNENNTLPFLSYRTLPFLSQPFSRPLLHNILCEEVLAVKI
mmetsp:Transcript_31740/g.47159  ORF Transcript_31740/g.47159 Transcript_31740/m.47159 type:complete len:163 (+) Transcript_31740:1129-1617(+)